MVGSSKYLSSTKEGIAPLQVADIATIKRQKSGRDLIPRINATWICELDFGKEFFSKDRQTQLYK